MQYVYKLTETSLDHEELHSGAEGAADEGDLGVPSSCSLKHHL